MEINDDDRLSNAWRRKAKDKNSFNHARRGNHLMVQFECDLCIHRKLQGSNPNSSDHTSTLLMACIRRVNLDAFWSRSSSTVEANALKVEQALKLSAAVGLSGPYLPPGPLPSYDHCGYETAIQMVLASKSASKHLASYTQWDTIRKVRTAYSNQVRSAALSNSKPLSIGDDDGRYSRITLDPCGSLWFLRTTQGCKRRMGQDWRPERAISTKLMLKVLKNVEERMRSAQAASEQALWVSAGTYFAVCYVVSLRGAEGLLLDIGGLRDHFRIPEEPYVVIALLGIVKGEHHERQHLLPCVNTTSSGIDVCLWIRRLLAIRYQEGRASGPAICDEEGKVLTSSRLNALFHEVLIEIFHHDRSLFLTDIKQPEDVEELYNVFRSFRRGSDSRAIAKQVSSIDIDVVIVGLKRNVRVAQDLITP